MKFSTLLILIVLTSQLSFSQRKAPVENDETSKITRCHTMKYEQKRRAQDPSIGSLNDFEKLLTSKIKQYKSDLRNKRTTATTVTIPIIFHIIHNGEHIGEGANIDNVYINAQIEQLNNDYGRKVGTSGFNNHADGASLDIQFCPATEDPSGNALTIPGINRINRNSLGWSAPPYGECSGTDFDETYIETTLKPQSIWPSHRYFNVWVTDLSCGTLGYAQFPNNSTLQGFPSNNGSSNTDGVVVNYWTIGSTSIPYPGTNTRYNKGRTLTHETGHWLGLLHTWGDGNCIFDDLCDDTPRCNGEVYAQFPACEGPVQCNGNTRMIENYMDYSDDACMNIFTNDQKTRVQTVLVNSKSLLSNSNISDCNSLIAEFTTSKKSINIGEMIQFTDQSESKNGISNWLWDFGDGNTSTTQNPQNTFNTKGIYTVSLTVTDNEGNSDTYFLTIAVEEGTTYNHLNGGTLTTIDASTISDGTGIISGHNSFNDLAKAEYFSEASQGDRLIEVDYYFKTATGNEIEFVIWDDNNGQPGAILANKTVLISSISTSGATTVDFGDVILNGPFYAGFFLNTFDGSNVALYTNSNGETTPTTAWELWSFDNMWYPFNDGTDATWETDISLAIYATLIGNCPQKPTVSFSEPSSLLASSSSTGTYQWFFNGSAIDGANSNTYNTSEVYGNYFVTLTGNNGCKTSSDVFSFNSFVTSILDNAFNASIKVFPNPVKSILNIDFGEQTTFGIEISLISTLGHEVKRRLSNGHKIGTINLSPLTNGVYFLRIKSPEGKFALKRIVKN